MEHEEVNKKERAFVRINMIQAKQFIKQMPDDIIYPIISVAEDGEVVVEYHTEKASLVIGFESDPAVGYYSYAIRIDNDKFTPGQVEGNLNKNLPSDILQLVLLLK